MQNKVKIIDGNSNCKWDEDYESIDYLSEEQWVSQQKEAKSGQEKIKGIGSESTGTSIKEGGTTTR